MNDQNKEAVGNLVYSLYSALQAATEIIAEDKRTKLSDRRWAVFTQCIAALDGAKKIVTENQKRDANHV